LSHSAIITSVLQQRIVTLSSSSGSTEKARAHAPVFGIPTFGVELLQL
jgi:hypothetical protein